MTDEPEAPDEFLEWRERLPPDLLQAYRRVFKGTGSKENAFDVTLKKLNDSKPLEFLKRMTDLETKYQDHLAKLGPLKRLEKPWDQKGPCPGCGRPPEKKDLGTQRAKTALKQFLVEKLA